MKTFFEWEVYDLITHIKCHFHLNLEQSQWYYYFMVFTLQCCNKNSYIHYVASSKILLNGYEIKTIQNMIKEVNDWI